MNFPDWAPKNLIERYLHYPRPREYGDDLYPPCPFDPDEHIAQLRKDDKKFNQMSNQQQDNYRTSLSRSEFGLPPEAGKKLLGTLLTDLRMAPVWNSLGKKIKEEVEFLYFWDQCQKSVLEWLGGAKTEFEGAQGSLPKNPLSGVRIIAGRERYGGVSKFFYSGIN